MILESKAHVFGDNINADQIISTKYISEAKDIEALISYFMGDIRPGFSKMLEPGNFIVGGENFGAGSSRVHATLLFKHAGVGAVIARSFGRSFYRNAVNQALLLIECDWHSIHDFDVLRIDLKEGYLNNLNQTDVFKIKPLSSMINKILNEGGLINYYKKHKKWPV